jgi:glycosyltransferase involved in cell wall biosynthesis
MKIGFITTTNLISSPSGRLRAFNLIDMLNNHGEHQAELYTPSSLYDCLVFVKACRPEDLKLLKSFQGLTVLDLCDNLLERSPYTPTETIHIARKMAETVTAVSVCSEKLGEVASNYNDNIFYIPDMIDYKKRKYKIVWFGLASNYRTLKQYLNIFVWLSKKYEFELYAIADWSNCKEEIPIFVKKIEWHQNLNLCEYDLFFGPKMNQDLQWENCKSDNKLLYALKQGLDCIVSPIPEYEKISELFPSKVKCFNDLMELEEYLREKIEQFNNIQSYHSREFVFKEWLNLIKIRGIQKPLVTVITAAYNAEKTIDETIQSVINQSYNNFEYIITNDCSTDNTLSILREWEKKDSRIKIINNKKNLRQGKSRNKAIKAARGSLIANIDADDLMHKDRLKNCVEFLKHNEDIDLVYTGYTKFRTGMPFGVYDKPKDFSETIFFNQQNLICNSTVMFRKGLFYDTDFVYGEDYLTWLKAIKIGYKFSPLDINSTYYRISDTQETKKFSNEKLNECAKQVQEKYKNFDITKPKISIIMPTYNRKKIIPKSIESVLSQSFQDWELIIVNDGGEDISSVIQKYKDKRIKYFVKENGGLSSALNKGIEFAKANLIALLDDDDLWIQDHLKILYEKMSTKTYDIVYANCKRIKPNGILLNKYNLKFNKKELLRERNLITTCSVLFKKKVWSSVNGFDEELKSHMDWDFWKKAIKKGFAFKQLNKYTSFYIAHGGNMLLSKNPIHQKDRIMVKERYL